MSLLNQLTRIERMDQFIRTRSTGTPEEFAQKLGISPSHLYQILKFIKETMHTRVYYSKTHQSYCYEDNVRFFFGYQKDI